MKECSDEQLAAGFYKALLFMKERVENDGWKESSNYLREHVRCASRLKFTNTRSPDILRMLRAKYPELKRYIKIKPLKENGRLL